MALWKQAGDILEPARQVLVESLLKSAAASDASFADARLQLGILYANQHKFAEAIAQYEQALKINSENATVHYRLGQSLARSGATDRAKEEFAEFERLRTQEVDAANKKSAEISNSFTRCARQTSDQRVGICYELALQVNTAELLELFVFAASLFIGHTAGSRPDENCHH